MTRVIDLALISAAIYDGRTYGDWQRKGFRAAWEGWVSDGLQAGLYSRGDTEKVIAFRGTNISLRLFATIQDLTADLVLGMGMNSAYFTAAQAFVSRNRGGSNVVLCGHSLGGAIAQVVGNRMGIPFATFNSPGVAVWASRNMSGASKTLTAVRTVGMVASAILEPGQAMQDIGAAFAPARGLNVRLDLDPVSKLGVHYGEVVDVNSGYRGINPIERHSISNVISSLTGRDLAERDSSSFA